MIFIWHIVLLFWQRMTIVFVSIIVLLCARARARSQWFYCLLTIALLVLGFLEPVKRMRVRARIASVAKNPMIEGFIEIKFPWLSIKYMWISYFGIANHFNFVFFSFLFLPFSISISSICFFRLHHIWFA